MSQLRSDLANGFRRYVYRLWTTRGGGFYGFVAVLMFLYLEVVDLAGDVAGLDSAHIGLGWFIGQVVSFFVDTVVNTVRAAIWPASWIGQFGVGLLSASLLAGSYVAYRAVRPSVLRWLTTGEPEPDLVVAAEVRRVSGA